MFIVMAFVIKIYYIALVYSLNHVLAQQFILPNDSAHWDLHE